jgi:prepilin peptidase CpaA
MTADPVTTRAIVGARPSPAGLSSSETVPERPEAGEDARAPKPAADGRAPVPWPEAWTAVVCLAAVVATVGALTGSITGRGLFLPAICLGTALLAAGFDAATGRIPNPITYTGILLGLLLNCAGPALQPVAPRLVSQWLGAAGPTQAALGLLVFGGIGLVGLMFAGMGGGDMKLLAAIGAILGVSRATDALMVGGAVAVAYALVNLLIAGRLNATVRVAAVHLLMLVYLRERAPLPVTTPSRRTIPLAIPLLVGLLIARIPAVTGAVGWLTNPS